MYLGHLVTSETIVPDPATMMPIMIALPSTSVTAVPTLPGNDQVSFDMYVVGLLHVGFRSELSTGLPSEGTVQFLAARSGSAIGCQRPSCHLYILNPKP